MKIRIACQSLQQRYGSKQELRLRISAMDILSCACLTAISGPNRSQSPCSCLHKYTSEAHQFARRSLHYLVWSLVAHFGTTIMESPLMLDIVIMMLEVPVTTVASTIAALKCRPYVHHILLFVAAVSSDAPVEKQRFTSSCCCLVYVPRIWLVPEMSRSV